MFLVRRAGDVMERDVTIVPAEADFGEFSTSTQRTAFGTSSSRAAIASSA